MKKKSERGNNKNKGIDDTGLDKRPRIAQIVNYLGSGQERINCPDREAKFIRNHPFITQLDFFDMQEEHEREWEETARQEEPKQIAIKTKESKAMVLAQ